MSIDVDMRIDPSRHDGQSLQIVRRALSGSVGSVDPRDYAFPCNDDTHIAGNPTFAIE